MLDGMKIIARFKSVCEKWFVGPNSSEKVLGKAEVKSARRRTEVRRGPLFADNADPRPLQPSEARKTSHTRSKRWNPWQKAQALLLAIIVLLAGVVVWQLGAPVTLEVRVNPMSAADAGPDANEAIALFPLPDSNVVLSVASKRGLFKSKAPLRDTPRADVTVEKILGQLKLQCVLDIGGAPMAYIQVKGQGLKGLRLGDAVDDMFQVTQIDVEAQSIEILIADQKEVLRL